MAELSARSRKALALALLALLACCAGCATTDDTENTSERPWASPKSWEHGFPIEMMEGR